MRKRGVGRQFDWRQRETMDDRHKRRCVTPVFARKKAGNWPPTNAHRSGSLNTRETACPSGVSVSRGATEKVGVRAEKEPRARLLTATTDKTGDNGSQPDRRNGVKRTATSVRTLDNGRSVGGMLSRPFRWRWRRWGPDGAAKAWHTGGGRPSQRGITAEVAGGRPDQTGVNSESRRRNGVNGPSPRLSVYRRITASAPAAGIRSNGVNGVPGCSILFGERNKA